MLTGIRRSETEKAEMSGGNAASMSLLTEPFAYPDGHCRRLENHGFCEPFLLPLSNDHFGLTKIEAGQIDIAAESAE
jgi:hypothetical protein